MTGGSWQDLVAAVAAEGRIGAIALEIARTIHEQMPQLGDDPSFLDATRASTAANMELFAGAVRSGESPGDVSPPPEAVAHARDLARRGVPPADLIRSYAIGQATVWEFVMADIRRHYADRPEVLAHAMESASRWMYAFTEAITWPLTEEHAAERDRWVRTADALKANALAAILAGDTGDPGRLSRELRYVGRHHVAFLVWQVAGPGDAPAVAADAVAAEVAAALGARDPLLVALGGTVLAGWAGLAAAPSASAARSFAFDVPAGLAVALGTPGSGVDGFRRSHAEAQAARRVAGLRRQEGGLVSYRDVSLPAIATLDPEATRQFVLAELGPLGQPDDGMRRLAATLRAYLEEQGSPRRTARRLGIHENTVANRIKAARTLLGRPLEERGVELQVALLLADIVGSADSYD